MINTVGKKGNVDEVYVYEGTRTVGDFCACTQCFEFGVYSRDLMRS